MMYPHPGRSESRFLIFMRTGNRNGGPVEPLTPCCELSFGFRKPWASAVCWQPWRCPLLAAETAATEMPEVWSGKRCEPGKRRGSRCFLPELKRSKGQGQPLHSAYFIYAEPGREGKWKEVPRTISDDQLWETQGVY